MMLLPRIPKLQDSNYEIRYTGKEDVEKKNYDEIK